MSTISRVQAEPPLILTLDVGSSSLRASFYDAKGRAVEGCEARTAYTFDTTADGGVEKDPDELLQIAYGAIDGAIKNIGDRISAVKAVAIDTFWHSVLGVDKTSQAITPIFSWADTRSAAAAAQLRRELDERDVHARTGCLIHASYYPAKLRWLSTAQPVIFRRVARWVSFGEYLFLKIFGESKISISMASGTGLLNIASGVWDKQMLADLQLSPNNLSPLGDLNTPQYGLTGEFAARWPGLKAIPWFPAVGDGATSNLGSGCFSPNQVAINVGTSGAMRVIWTKEESHKLVIPFGLWCYRADRNRFVLGGSLSEGGNLFAWMRDTFQLPELEEVEAELSRQEPAGHGLTVLPFLSGERAPGWAAQARAAITGLSLNTKAIEILRAGIESIAYRFGLIYSLLEPALPATKSAQIIASGGALLHSPTWLQIIADVLNRPVIASGEAEATSRGAALLALEQLGVFGAAGLKNAEYSLESAYQPDAARHACYQQAMQEQQELYRLLVKPRI